MLQWLRGRAQNIAVKLFLSLIIVTFLVWGVGDMLRRVGNDHVAMVGKYPITASAFMQALQVERQRSPQNASHAIAHETLSRLIHRALLEQFAADSGIRVSASDVVRYVREYHYFDDDKGEWDPERFAQFLRAQQWTESDYIARMQRDLSVQLLVDSLIGIYPKQDKFAELLMRYRLRTANMTLYRIDHKAVTIEAPSEDALQQHYALYAHRFEQPETRELQLIVMDKKALKGTLAVSDQEIHAIYTNEKDQFTRNGTLMSLKEATPLIRAERMAAMEQRAVQALVETIQDRLAGGEKAEAIARDLSLSTKTLKGSKAQILSQRPHAYSPKAWEPLITELFSYDLHQESNAVPLTDHLLAIGVVTALTEASVPPLTAIRKEIELAYRHEKQRSAMQDYATTLLNRLREKKTLVGLAHVTPVTLRLSLDTAKGQTVDRECALSILTAVDGLSPFPHISESGDGCIGIVTGDMRYEKPITKAELARESEPLQQLLGQTLFDEFIAVLQTRYPVTLYRAPESFVDKEGQ